MPLMNTTIIFLLLAPVVTLSYMIYVFNPAHADNMFMYVLQLIADSISIMVLLSLWVTILLDVFVAGHHRIHKDSANDRPLEPGQTVDVLIPVAGEPLEIIERTLRAVVAMDYPHQSFVLDDGKSEAVEKLAKELGITYVARTKKDFAKSGNVNHGLSFCKGKFFIIFDADQTPKKDFITSLLPYMSNKSLAMVQSPQHFDNTDHFIADGTAQAQEIFYQYVCPSKNISNSAFCVGTNVLFRRSAIDGIGGIALVNHSEDIWTSFLLHQNGWLTLFVNEILAEGKAPTTISSFFKQQLRWSKGGLTMLFLHNSFFAKKLSLDQKVQYFVSNSFFLVGFSIFIYLISPIVYLLFGLKAFQVESGAAWLIHYLPYFILYYSITWLLLGKIRLSTIAVSLASFYPYLLSFIMLVFGVNMTWVATTSKKNNSLVKLQWIWPHIFLMILTVMSLLVGWFRPIDIASTAISSLWAIIDFYLLYIFVTSEQRIVA